MVISSPKESDESFEVHQNRIKMLRKRNKIPAKSSEKMSHQRSTPT